MLDQSPEQALRPAPAAPPPPAGPGTAVIAPQAPVSTPISELQGLSYRELQSRLSELRSQRSDLASRREALASNYENSSGANREGMGARLTELDNNIVMYEREIAAVGREMAVKVPQRGVTSVPPGGNNRPYDEEDMAGAVFGTFLTTTLVLFFVMRRFMRRKYAGSPADSRSQPNMVQSHQRLDRIEQAVDTIAVEIERISENQRFMTRLMTETQLGATLNEVRKSTELAKEAAGASASLARKKAAPAGRPFSFFTPAGAECYLMTPSSLFAPVPFAISSMV